MGTPLIQRRYSDGFGAQLRFVARSLAAASIILATVQLPSPSIAPGIYVLKNYNIKIGIGHFRLQAVDIGRRYDCRSGQLVGVVLKDSSGWVRWASTLSEPDYYLSTHGCGLGFGTTYSSIVGVATPTENDAVWGIETLICGASCAGSGLQVFHFRANAATIDSSTGRYRSGITEEVQEGLGHGGLTFDFPWLVLYVKHDYKACPTGWTRMVYQWRDIPDSGPKFRLLDTVNYISNRCVFSPMDLPRPAG